MMIDEDNSTVKELAKETVKGTFTMLLWVCIITLLVYGVYWGWTGDPYIPDPLKNHPKVFNHHIIFDGVSLICICFLMAVGYYEKNATITTIANLIFDGLIGIFVLIHLVFLIALIVTTGQIL